MKDKNFDKIDTILTGGLIMMTVVALLLAVANLVITNKKEVGQTEVGQTKEITTITSKIVVTFYPEPICEFCGKPLDGTHEKCVPEGE